MQNNKLFKTTLLVLAVSSMILGCDKKDFKRPPTFDDRQPPAPKLAGAYDDNGMPEPMDLSKGAALKAIEHSKQFLDNDFDINEQIKLDTLLTGYFGFNEYLMARTNDFGGSNIYYAKNAHIDTKTANLVVFDNDWTPASKKNAVI